MHFLEPFYGWLHLYSHDMDPRSPFHEVDHNQFFYDRQVYDYLAHPLWDTIGSEGLLVKILYANYDHGYAIIELFGVWNDLLENDFRLLSENCLEPLLDGGISKFIFIGENLLNIYLDADDYYQEMQDNLGEGWMCLIGAREHVRKEMQQYSIDTWFWWSPALDGLHWRKLQPPQLFALVQESMNRILPR